jgi:hypothetical protein
MASSELGKKMIATNPRKTAKKAYSTSSSPCSSAKNSDTVFLIPVVQFCNRSLQGVNETTPIVVYRFAAGLPKLEVGQFLLLLKLFKGKGI